MKRTKKAVRTRKMLYKGACLHFVVKFAILTLFSNSVFADSVQLKDLVKPEDISSYISSWEKYMSQYHSSVFMTNNVKKVSVDLGAKEKLIGRYLKNLGRVNEKKMGLDIFEKLGAKEISSFYPNVYGSIQARADARQRFIEVGLVTFKIFILKSDVYIILDSAYDKTLENLAFEQIRRLKNIIIRWNEIQTAIQERDCYTVPCPEDDCKIEDGKCVEKSIGAIAGVTK